MGRSQSGRFLYNLLWIYYNPTAAAAFFQEGAGAIFGEENAGSVDGAAHEDMPALHFFTERRKNGRHAINGEHPDGCLAGHFLIFFSAQRAASGP